MSVAGLGRGSRGGLWWDRARLYCVASLGTSCAIWLGANDAG